MYGYFASKTFEPKYGYTKDMGNHGYSNQSISNVSSTLQHSQPKRSTFKNIIFEFYGLLPEAAIKACKVLSKELRPQVKKFRIFFRKLDLSAFSSDSNDYYMKKYLFEQV